MHKLFNAFLVLGVLISGFLLYSLEYATRSLERKIASAERQIKESKEGIKLLNAEWASLSRPERLQRLAEEHLHLETIKAEQIVRLDDLGGKVPPEPIMKLEALDKDPIGDILKKIQ